MVVIRLKRGGAKKRPFYHIVATDSRKKRDAGRCLALLGYFNPIASGQEKGLHVERERVAQWLERGAQPSLRVSSLLQQWDKQNTQGLQNLA